MAYTYQNELRNVLRYYKNDRLQKRFSLLLCGPTGSGKTYTLRTARKPIHIDSFDPGGTKSIRDLIEKRECIADTRWEKEDPYAPTRFAKWMTSIDQRLAMGYFDHFGTYCLDSATKWGDAVMNYQLGTHGAAGDLPTWGDKDYTKQKRLMENYIIKLMNIPCDFILTGHLKEFEEVLRIDPKTGIKTRNVTYRFYTTGQAVITIPLLFDELYVLETEETSNGYERKFLLEAQGKYLARSRLKGDGLLNDREPADIKALLRKIGLSDQDKPPLDFGEEKPSVESESSKTD